MRDQGKIPKIFFGTTHIIISTHAAEIHTLSAETGESYLGSNAFGGAKTAIFVFFNMLFKGTVQFFEVP